MTGGCQAAWPGARQPSRPGPAAQTATHPRPGPRRPATRRPPGSLPGRRRLQAPGRYRVRGRTAQESAGMAVRDLREYTRIPRGRGLGHEPEPAVIFRRPADQRLPGVTGPEEPPPARPRTRRRAIRAPSGSSTPPLATACLPACNLVTGESDDDLFALMAAHCPHCQAEGAGQAEGLTSARLVRYRVVTGRRRKRLASSPAVFARTPGEALSSLRSIPVLSRSNRMMTCSC